MRWIEQGCKIRKNCNIYYSCHAEKREFGWGCVLDQSLRHFVLGFTPANERWEKSHQGKVPQYKPDLRACPHGRERDAVKDAFYANIEELYDKCLAHDIKIVLGNYNAKGGKEGIPLSDSSASTRQLRLTA